MTNLVPERRINKNGVSVLKHVRPDAAPKAAPQNGFPAPKAEPEADAAAVMHRNRWAEILRIGEENPLSENQQFMRLDKLVTLGDETLSRFEELLELAPSVTDKHALTKMMGKFRPVQQVRARVNSFYAFKDLIGTDDKFAMNILSAAIDGLYPHDIMFEVIDYSKPSLYSIARPKIEIIAALYRSPKRHLGGKFDLSELILNDAGAVYACSGLQRVVIENPNRTDDIVKLIVDRNMDQSDMPALRNMMKAPTTALMEGVL